MTDDALDPRDELASAHLDGETTPAEADRVAADEDLTARVAAFATTRDAVRAEGGPVDDARREEAIAAALAAFDEPGAVVTPLARRRRPTPERWLPLVGVAAAVLVAALLVPLLVRDRGDEDPVTEAGGATTTLAAPFAAEDSSGAARTESAPADESTAARLAAPAPVSDLGPHADVESLADAARAALASPPTTVPGTPSPTAPPEAEPCLAGLRLAAADAGAATLLEATAVLDGRPVVAVVTQRPDGAQVLDVEAVAGCAPVASVQLASP